MANKPAQAIVIKKVQGGHAAAHGGAWKVAYADFVTAMMCFFLVMWLMGSDEETKASVSNYFNNPTSAWRRDLSSKDSVPLGDKTGSGDSILAGAGAGVPEDLVKRPTQIMNSEAGTGDSNALGGLLENTQMLELDVIRFSIPEDQLFVTGTMNEWQPKAKEVLAKLGNFTKTYDGKLRIIGQYDRKSSESGDPTGTYEYQLDRTVKVTEFLVEGAYLPEENIKSIVQHNGAGVPTTEHGEQIAGNAEERDRSPASETPDEPVARKITFELTKNKKN